jgi:iron complex outermembrane receptor protein
MTYRTSRASARRSAVLGGTALASAALLGSAAFAQAQPTDKKDDTGIEKIVVTATFRQTEVQNTPIAITAVNAAMLEARNQTNVAQISAQAPNVTLEPHGQAFGSSLVAYIRGIGQTDFNFASEPGVGVYVDDVYYATITGNILDLLDLDRVEVLRGPQGTLAGKNSIGGAIKLFTKQPTGDDDGWLEGAYGSYNRVDVRGAADLTVVPDKLFVRISGASRSRDGYVQRVDYACEHPELQGTGFPSLNVGTGCGIGTLGGQNYTAARFQARWLVSDRLEFNLSADATNDHSEAQAGVLVQATEYDPKFVPPGAISVSGVPIFFDKNHNGILDAGDIPFDNRFATPGTYKTYSNFLDLGQNPPPSQCQLAGVPVAPGVTFGTACVNMNQFKPLAVPPINYFVGNGGSLTADWKITDNLTLKSITAYRSYKNMFANDDDGSPLAVQELLQTLRHEQYSQEFRLSGALGDKFDYTVGVFGMKQNGTLEARVDLPYTAFDFRHGPDKTPSSNLAGFLNVDFRPIDRLELSGGVRYSSDTKDYTFHRHNPDGTPITAAEACVAPPWLNGITITPGPGFIPNPLNCAVAGGGGVSLDGLEAHFKSDSTDYRAAASFKVTDDIMVYAQTATGYKGGGIDARPFVPDQAVSFGPEKLTAYEVGVKSALLDRKVRLNAAYFYNIYKDIQLIRRICPESASTTCLQPFNGGDADVQGFELEAEAHPAGGLTFDASVSTLDFKYTRLDPLAEGGGVHFGMITPYTPELKASVGAQYEFPLSEALGSLTPRIDANYQSKIFTDATNASTNQIDAYPLANASLTWRSPSEMWSASFQVTNLFDRYYYLTKNDLSTSAGFIYGQPGRPREFALTLKRTW